MSSYQQELTTFSKTAASILSNERKNSYSEHSQFRKDSEKTNVWLKVVTKTKNQNPNNNQDELTFQDLKYNLWCGKLLTVLKILPNEMKIQTGRMKINYKNNNSKPTSFTLKTKFLATVWAVFVLGRICILIIDTSYLLSNDGDATESDGMKMLRRVFCTFGTFVCTGLYDGYQDTVLKHMASINILYNSMLQKMKRRENQHLGLGGQLKNKLKSLVQRPFRVNLLIHLPIVIYSLMLVVPGVIILDPKSPLLLSSHILELKDEPFYLILYIGLTILDNAYWFFMFSLIYYAVFYMLLFMIRIDEDSKTAIKQVRLPDGLKVAVKSLQLVKLEILQFNLRFSNIVYLTKLIALAAAITGGFLMIKLMHSNPLFALPFVLFFFEGNILYIVLFNNVYEITRKLDVLKEEILIRVQMQVGPDQSKKEEYNKICASIQRLGIQAGGFAFMEREATLTFGDYVTQQIVSLLLTFK